MIRRLSRFALAILAAAAQVMAADDAKPHADPVLEAPTLRSLGVYWIIAGDDNRNATIAMDHRVKGQKEWRKGFPLFRTEKGALKHPEKKGGSRVQLPDGAWLFAGSALLLEPGTEYEIRLKLSDPDGGAAEKSLSARTSTEPVQPKDARVRHVAPGSGGGSGSEQDPFKGLGDAQAAAKPGDLFLVHGGSYPGVFTVSTSGEAGRPIIWRGAGDGEAVIEGAEADGKQSRVISASAVHDVWFEDLTVRNGEWGIVLHGSSRIVVRRCRIHQVEYGIDGHDGQQQQRMDGFFIADNVIDGPSTWPRTKGIEDARGIQLCGVGHDICYNRITGFADAIDIFPGVLCEAIDIHNNDCHVLTDDGCEMDYSERNTRCFENRFTNAYQGISMQPVFGGPVYIFRNTIYNVCVETYKMHNSPTGVLLFHNTSVKKGVPVVVMTPRPITNCWMRNNLFAGSDSDYACQLEVPVKDCDFDYAGFSGGPWKHLIKWNNQRLDTVEDIKAKTTYRHFLVIDQPFAAADVVPKDENVRAAATPDLSLREESAGVDAGEVLPGLNDGFAGKAPDLGAFERGAEPPHYGPRPAATGK
jgi:hypothetical protein